MSLLFNVLFAAKCKGTHHKLAMDALLHLRGDDALRWRNLFLTRIEPYLTGSKDPDKKFRDFKNHVLHVQDGYWGGAATAARKWYDRTVEALRAERWTDGVYAAGVLSHYYTDPLQPLHTAQSEAESAIHRAAEWSMAQCYDEFRQIIVEDFGGYPEVDRPDGPDWLETMVREGADLANPHYEVVIDHYDLERGRKDPPAGLDQEIKDRIARVVAHAVVGFARILEQAFAEADVKPPDSPVTLHGVLSALTVPIFKVTRRMANSGERRVVESMYRELKETGRVLKTLPEDERTVRALHAQEILGVPVQSLDAQTPRPAGTQYGAGAEARPRGRRRVDNLDRRRGEESRPPSDAANSLPAESVNDRDRPGRAESTIPAAGGFAPMDLSDVELSESPSASPSTPVRDVRTTATFHLDTSSPVEEAPSVGPKTARRLLKLGVRTVKDLLELDAVAAADGLGVRWIDAERIRAWQHQAGLVCRIPNLRGHDAQVLVASGVTDAEDITDLSANDLLELVSPFVDSVEGDRVIRSSRKPDLEEVAAWIAWSRAARPLRAA